MCCVRAERSRRRKVGEALLWDRMEKEPIAWIQGCGSPTIRWPSLPDTATECSLFSSDFTPPKDTNLPTITVWAVHAREREASGRCENRLNWIFLTTVETSSFEQAWVRVDWYCRRWGIETYHRTLKSGCRIEDRRLDDADSIMTSLDVDMVVAWRTLWLTMKPREDQDISCDGFFTQDEWHILLPAWPKWRPIPPKPPSLVVAVFIIAALGGFLRRVADGFPGTTHIWRGGIRLTRHDCRLPTSHGLPPRPSAHDTRCRVWRIDSSRAGAEWPSDLIIQGFNMAH